MKQKRGTYYLSRIIKLGELDSKKLLFAINNPPIVSAGKFNWTITDVVDCTDTTEPYIFANLSKYFDEGEVKLINEKERRQVKSKAQDLLKASAPFVYLPDFSGIAYMHVWNEIDESVFPRRFKEVIEAAYNGFFVGCELDPISDLRSFLAKLNALDKITELSAKVHPTNPLFGRLWEDLDKYVKERNADQVTINETSSSGLHTELKRLISGILSNEKWEPERPASITDAAILMAVDGYGVGSATGIENGEEVTIKTSKTRKSFLFLKEPNPEDLAKKARRVFSKISSQSDMSH